LPLVMAALLGFVIAAFLAVAYQQVKANLVHAAGTRAQATADQLAGLFVQSTQQRLTELQKFAAHPTLRQLLERPDGDALDAARGRLGCLVVRRPLNGGPTMDVLNRLVGQGATISLGNKTGDVWTDLAKAIAPPAINLARPGVAQYTGANGRSVGALIDIRGT